MSVEKRSNIFVEEYIIFLRLQKDFTICVIYVEGLLYNGDYCWNICRECNKWLCDDLCSPLQAMRFGDLPPWALELSSFIREDILLSSHFSESSSEKRNEKCLFPAELLWREPLFNQLIVNIYQPGEVSSDCYEFWFLDDLVLWHNSIGGQLFMYSYGSLLAH